MKKICLFLLFTLTVNIIAVAQLKVYDHQVESCISIVNSSRTTYIYTDSSDNWLIQKSAQLLQADIESVTSHKPLIVHTLKDAKNNLIIIGCINSTPTIQKLANSNKIHLDTLKNKWEAFQIASVNSFSKNISSALIITGSDKRGTAYGVFELSRQIGVSPWYWWADVPPIKKKEIYLKKAIFNSPTPSVKYRGIFINDEAPAFSGWTKEKFGGVNHLVYEKIFELLLRLKANYLWPAMWGNAFNDDDTLNPVLADKYGIVMGTSHHEPMLRAQQEWKRYGKGPWDYTKNDSVLRIFWQKGIENMKSHESIITVGMRGDGDMPMTQGTATELLEKIVKDQRNIIEEVIKKPAYQQPQLWALYKEVQDYYDKGMKVPDDITLLLCDDNWGNIRKLPKLSDPKRAGGYGIYYHFDYVGGPRNYKWINTNNIARVWEQMHLAYEYGVDKIWIVNVGDIKPMELPITFFLDYAYNTKKWNETNLSGYYTHWGDEIFGKTNGAEIGKIAKSYAQISSRRKPEMLDAKTYSLKNYDEFQSVVSQLENLQNEAEKLNQKIDTVYKDTYFQLILHPVKALNNLYHLYYYVALNLEAAKKHEANTNLYADQAKEYYIKDSLLSVEYNHLNNGKWNHMMDQTHIGYISWQEPRYNRMPAVKYIEADSVLPLIILPKEKDVSAINQIPKTEKGNIFFELNGVVSINAENFTKCINTKTIEWKIINDIGRTSSGISVFPVNSKSIELSSSSPCLQYAVYTYGKGKIEVNTYFSPTLNFHNEALKCAVSIDDESPQIVSINEGASKPAIWDNWVGNNIIIKKTMHTISKPGKHVIKFWMIDSGIVLQKIVADMGGLLPSYLGPNQTLLRK